MLKKNCKKQEAPDPYNVDVVVHTDLVLLVFYHLILFYHIIAGERLTHRVMILMEL